MQQPQQSGQQLRVSIAKLSPLDTGNKRLDFGGVCRIVVWIFLHRRWRRSYAARRSEARASGHFFPFFKPRCRKHTHNLDAAVNWVIGDLWLNSH
jgi:hypothetical protein